MSTLLSKNYVQNVPNNSKKYSFPLRLFFILIIPLFTSQASQGQLVISVSFPNVKRTLPPAVTTTFVNADAYSCFLEKEGLTWNPPRYKQQSKIPFIPSEAELNKLIGASGKKLSVFLEGLKETAADPGELAPITAKDINKESRTITLNHPVKGHRPRVIPVSLELIKRLESIAPESGRYFDAEQLRRAFLYMRKVTARKLSNPRLLNITFITFRHWKATMEYHRTKDILHVQRFLGHKNIQNTLIYIDLEANLFVASSEGFTTRIAQNAGEACSLIESGFEYVTGEYHDGGKIFRKRK